MNSLPDPEDWLRRARGQSQGATDRIDDWQFERLGTELDDQIAHCTNVAHMIERRWPDARMHAEAVTEQTARLQVWLDALQTPSDWSAVAEQIRTFKFPRATPRPRDLSDEEKAIFDAAKARRDEIKDLFTKRIAESICLFTA